MSKAPETLHSIRGIRSQMRRAINTCRDGADAVIPVGLAYRIEKALLQWEQEIVDRLEEEVVE